MEINETLSTNLQLTQLREIKDQYIERLKTNSSNRTAALYKLRKKVIQELDTSLEKLKKKQISKTYYDAMVFIDDELNKLP